MKHIYIKTLGCQMNKADSEHMLGLLNNIDYKLTENIDKADLVLFNTCTVREAANEKFYSCLGTIGKKKRQKPNILIAVSGCIAQNKRKWLQKNFPYIDLVIGTNNIHRLPQLIKKVETLRRSVSTGERVCEIFEELPYELPELPIIRLTKVTAWVNVILGCNFNCTYCIVPQVRGKERSRTPESILGEVKTLAKEGFKEVTLLGQNVTAYGCDFTKKSLKPTPMLDKLIRQVNDVEGIERIRFLTGHPFHVTDELVDTVHELPKACEYFHIPMQSGDDIILKRMARVYSVDKYKKMVGKIRAKMPDASITSDFIVGFPGETEGQFLNTIKVIHEIGFDACNTAAYSPRPGTPSASWDKQVPEEEKNKRLSYINSIVNSILEKKNKKYLDVVQEILVEGQSGRNKNRLSGRTCGNKIVNFEGDESLIGKLVGVKITQTAAWSMYGEIDN